MVTQAPKRSSVFAAIAFTLSCVGLIIFVWTQFGGTIPFSAQGYRIRAMFRETGLLVPNADVRIAGVTVGKVTDVQAQGLNSLVTIDVDRQYAPIPVDTHAILREKTLLGEAFVELSTGTGSGPKLADGGTLGPSQIEQTQQLDQVLNAFNRKTQGNLQVFLAGTGAALAGDGESLNAAVGNLAPAFTQVGAVVRTLDSQRNDLQRLISNGGILLSTLGARSTQLQSLITTGNQVLTATARRNAALTATVDALPPFLRQLQTTLRTTDGTLKLAKPALFALGPAVPLIRPALQDVIDLSGPAIRLLHAAPGLVEAANKALPAITAFGNSFRPAVDAIFPAARQVAPMIEFMAHYQNDLVAGMANTAAMLQAVGAAATSQFTAGTPAGTAHYGRVQAILNNETVWGQSITEPTNRHNTYYAPNGQSTLKTGLLASSCDNLHNTAQIPSVGFPNIACKVQSPFPWGDGVATSYYPHLVQVALPKKRK